jgi:hypothetical protein
VWVGVPKVEDKLPADWAELTSYVANNPYNASHATVSNGPLREHIVRTYRAPFADVVRTPLGSGREGVVLEVSLVPLRRSTPAVTSPGSQPSAALKFRDAATALVSAPTHHSPLPTFPHLIKNSVLFTLVLGTPVVLGYSA